MKSIFALLIAVVVSLVVAETATTATQDNGRRLTGPFCIGKPYLKPLGANGVPLIPLYPAKTYNSRLINAKVAILRAGVVRSVSAKGQCRPWETRATGLAVPCKTLTPLKPDIYCDGKSGPPGKDGAPGVSGKDGVAGAQGAAGAAGKVTVTQLTGSQANCVQITGSDGSNGVICGTAGPKGDKGNTGSPGICECKGSCSIKSHKEY